jgi:FKBP-type peptidyl-prolyl cis-trans isomerase
MKAQMTSLFLVVLAAACASSELTPAPAAGPPPPEETEPRADHEDPLDRAAAAEIPADAERTPSGLASKVLRPGTGKNHPNAHSTVRVHYTGWTSDGIVFDSSRDRGKPAEFALDQVILGWTEGVPLMVVGEERRFWIPAAAAYGKEATGGRPAGDLTFDIELLGILFSPDVPPTPPDVAAVPKDATVLPSGLAYKVIVPGDGDEPDDDDWVRIDYTGWSPDGRMFESTLAKYDGSVSFPLENGMKGWREGIHLMKVGGTTRFWIPAKLALGDNPPPPMPRGMTVWDVTLKAIEVH